MFTSIISITNISQAEFHTLNKLVVDETAVWVRRYLMWKLEHPIMGHSYIQCKDTQVLRVI